MLNLQIIEELAGKLAKVLPEVEAELKQDLEKNFREILRAAFKKMDLISAEEFNVQKQLLTNMHRKINNLESKVKQLENEKLN